MPPGVDQLANTMSVFRYGFMISLMFFLLFLAIATLLFIRYNMLAILQRRLGITARRAIKGYDEQAAKTGSLRHNHAVLRERTSADLLNLRGAAADLQEGSEETTVLSARKSEQEPDGKQESDGKERALHDREFKEEMDVLTHNARQEDLF